MSKAKKAFMFLLSTCSDAELQELLKEGNFSEGAILCIHEEIENRKAATGHEGR
ncbi:hypothetical protein [Clostridium porci]|uniref:hypothetical protein n=1 Tax=Clostridium porci TaxID=2605778 RepID=UPI0012B2986A|nr:hypothetical protein [Clostridium porci]